jgi:hypothetical protein
MRQITKNTLALLSIRKLVGGNSCKRVQKSIQPPESNVLPLMNVRNSADKLVIMSPGTPSSALLQHRRTIDIFDTNSPQTMSSSLYRNAFISSAKKISRTNAMVVLIRP